MHYFSAGSHPSSADYHFSLKTINFLQKVALFLPDDWTPHRWERYEFEVSLRHTIKIHYNVLRTFAFLKRNLYLSNEEEADDR